jgi:hypothetical protein
MAYKFLSTISGISTTFTGNSVYSNSTPNRTVKLDAIGLYLSRTSDGAYPSSISADGSMYYDTRNSHIFRNDTTTSMTIVDNTRNVLIGTSTDAGYKLDVNGTARINSTLSLTNSSFAGTFSFYLSAANIMQASSSNIGTWLQVGGGNRVYIIGQEFNSTARGNVFGNTVGGEAISATTIIAQSSGTTATTGLSLRYTINNTGTYVGTTRGIYYNPTVTSLTGTTHYAIETVVGDVILGSTSGNVGIGTTTLGTATKLTLGGSQTASSAIARGGLVNTTLVAAANNDVLVGLDVTPTFTNGAFTNVSNLAIRTNGNVQVRGNTTQFGLVLQVLNTAGSSIFYVRDVGDALLNGTLWLSAQNGSNFISGGQLGITSNTGTVGQQFIRFTHNNGNNAFRVLSNSNIELNPVAGNVLIGTTTDAGYKLDVNGTQRVQFGSTEVGLQMTHTNGNTASIVIGNGSSAGTGNVEFWRNGEYVAQYTSSFVLFRYANLRARNNTTLTLTGGIGYGATIGTSIRLSPNTSDGGAYTATSGTQSTIITGNGSNEIWQPSSGNATYNLLTLSPVINTSGTYSGTVRGLYINPTLTSVTGTSYNAIEATAGNVVFGSSSTPSQLFVNGGYGGTTPLDIYLANFYGTSTINTGFGTGSKQWLLIGRGSIPTTSGIAGINLGNNQYESGLLFATASGGVFSEKMRIWNTGNVTINSTTDAGYKLDVNGNSRIKGSGNTSATTTFRVENSSAGSAFTILGDGTVNMGFNATLTYGMTARSYGSNGGYPGLGVYLISQNYGNAAGNAATIAYSGSPAGVTSNGLVIGGVGLQSATYNALVVNQSYTGLGTNTLVGYLFDPTLDATFPDANVIAIKANKGKVLLGTTSGNIILGTTTDNGNKLQVTGNITASGGVIASTLGAQNSAEINVNESGNNLLVYADITSGPDNLYSGGQVKANIYTSSVTTPTTINTGTTVSLMNWYPATTQGVMIDYVFYIDGGTYMRSGTFTAVNDTSGNAQYVDNATPDLNGSTSTVTFAAVNNGGTMEFQVTNTSGSPVYMNILTRYIPTLF